MSGARLCSEQKRAVKLVRELQHGSAKAFDTFYNEYVPLMYRIAFSMTGDRMEAEDICHDVFLELLNKWDQYDAERGSMEAWLAVRTKSRCLDRLRRRQRIRFQSWDGEAVERSRSASGETTEELVLRQLEKETLLGALGRLPANQREAVHSMYFREHTQRQLAEQLGRPLGTVKSMIRYGLNNLKKQLAFSWTEGTSAKGEEK